MQYPGFIFGANESQAFSADQQRTINWYVETTQAPGAPARAALLPTPGVKFLGNSNAGLKTGLTAPGRAHFFESGREFAVVGTKLFEINQAGTMTYRGTVTQDENPATISSNGDAGGQLLICSGTNAYYYVLSTNVLTQITGMDGLATMGDFLDGYGLILDSATSTLYVSALADMSSWTPGTNFTRRSVASDPWVAMKVLGRYVWLLGSQTSEAWYNAGGLFPLALHPSSLVRYGCAAPWSVGVAEQSLLWLGSSRLGEGYVVETQGFTPRVVSSFAVQNDINKLGGIATAQGDVYIDSGHTFYLLSFGSGGKTWAYDLTEQIWAERGTWIAEDSEWVAWRPRWHVQAFGESRWLDSETGQVWLASKDFHVDVTAAPGNKHQFSWGGTPTVTDYRPLRRLRRAPAIYAEQERIFYSSFEVELESGKGLKTGQGSDPHVMMRLSNDGGKTWSAESWVTADKIGEYQARVNWHRMGQARRRVFEISVTDPIPWTITNAYLKLGQQPKVGMSNAGR